MSSANLESLVTRLEAAVNRLEAAGGAAGAKGAATGDASAPPAGAEVTAPTVTAYDDVTKDLLASFVEKSDTIGEDVKEVSQLAKKGFEAQRVFLVQVSKAKQPSEEIMAKLLKPLSEAIMAVSQFRESQRTSKYFNHLSAVSESMPALGWVTVSPTPGPFVKEMSDAGQFYANRVLKEYKEKDAVHVEWVQTWSKLLTSLQSYIKQFYTTGISWNSKGVDAATLLSGTTAGPPPPPPPAPAGGPPPPPPPPSSVAAAPTSDSSDSAGDNRGDLFASLNKGSDITKGLKRVTDDMKTHKNPVLRQGPALFKPYISPKPTRAVGAPVAAVAKVVAKKPPVCELQGKKWIIENQENNREIVIDDVNTKQTVYIYKCVNTVVQVKGKVNSITMDSCKKSAVVCESLVSTLEFVNCQSVKGQTDGAVPTISIDKTDGCLVFLSGEAVKAQFITAKSSEMNIALTKADGDIKEFPIPEQFKTIIQDGKIMTTTMELNL